MSADEAGLGDELRTVFAGLADALIPAGSGLPSGGEVAIDRGGLDAVLAVRGDMVADLRRLLEAAREADPVAEVDRLRAEDEAGFQALTTAVGGGYFLDAEVRESLGYRGQEAVPIEHTEPRDYEREGLLDSVAGRGPIYRSTP